MINECANIVFRAFAVGCRHFDWLDNLREHIGVDQIIRQKVMSERDANKGDLEWAGIMEECRRELSCVCQKMAQAVGWPPGRSCRPQAPKPNEQREKAMRTSRVGRHLFTSSNEDSEEDEPEGRRARPRNPWLAQSMSQWSVVTTVHVPMSLRARTTAQSESTYICTNEPVWARTAV